MELNSFLQGIPHKVDEIQRSTEDALCDISHVINSDFRQVRMNSRSNTSNSGIDTMISGSYIKDVCDRIRSRLLDISNFDSNYDSKSKTISKTHSSEKRSITKAIPYQHLDNTVTEDGSCTSTNHSYNLVNLPLELQNDHMVMDVEDDSNEDIIHLEELLSDISGEQEGKSFKMRHPIPSNEEESDLPSGDLSMKIKEMISKIRESTDKTDHINEYVRLRLMKVGGEDSVQR